MLPTPALIALQFLTRLPVRLPGMPEPEQIGRSLLWYPLVGVLLGYRLEGRWLDSHAQVATWRRLLAAALGAGAFVLLQMALKALADLWPLQDWLWQVVRGLIMGLFVAALMPWVLVRLRLLGARAPRRLASEVLE